MKKLIALTVCAMLLLSGCSAMTADGSGSGMQIHDIAFSNQETACDLTGLSISYGSAMTEDAAGWHILFDGGEYGTASAAAAVTGEALYLCLDSDGERDVYSLDISALMEDLMGSFTAPALSVPEEDGTEADLPGEITEEMTDEEMEALLSEWAAALAEEAEEDGALSEDGDIGADWDIAEPDWSGEDYRDQNARLEQASEIIERCTAEGQEEINGVTYELMAAHFGAEEMKTLLNTGDALAVGGLYFPLGDVLAAGGLSFTFDGSLAYSEDGTRYLAELSPSVTTREGSTYTLTVTVDATDGTGDIHTGSTVTKDGSETLSDVSLVLSPVETESSDWLEDILNERAVSLNGMATDELAETLSDGTGAFADCLQSMFSGIIEANS